MSMTLFRNTLKRNWVLLAIFLGVLSMYMSVMLSMYDPDDMEALSTMIKLFPPGLMKAMGFDSIATNLTGYLASWLYGLLMLGFPLVYCVILGNRLVAKMVDNSSFAYLLSTPNSRVKIIVTQGIYALASVATLMTVMFGVGVLLSAVVFPGLLDVGQFLRLNVTTMLVNMTVMMVSFFFSCLFNETRFSLLFGAGIPIVFLLMKMLGGVSEDGSMIKKASIYGFYDPVKLVAGESMVGVNLIYIAIILVLFAGGVTIFSRKRLPL
ncbi:MAG: ABC transporter permease [Youngiibacter sp.]|nr:ABC transporter permease [Youngiibacter sp.]